MSAPGARTASSSGVGGLQELSFLDSWVDKAEAAAYAAAHSRQLSKVSLTSSILTRCGGTARRGSCASSAPASNGGGGTPARPGAALGDLALDVSITRDFDSFEYGSTGLALAVSATMEAEAFQPAAQEGGGKSMARQLQ